MSMKQLTILFVFVSAATFAQNAKSPKLKLSVPCTNEFANSYKGKWLITKDESNYSSEVKKRFQQIHELLLQTYPQPTGGDAAWNGAFMKASFADQVKYEMRNDKLEEQPMKINPVYSYTYHVVVYPWYCCGTNEICNIYPEISGGVGLTIVGNYLHIFSGKFKGGDLIGNIWTIEGRPIQMKRPAIGMWKGYELMTSEGGALAELSSARFVLISRSGILPYVPVTRKEFFDRAILYVTKFYDNAIAGVDQTPDNLYYNKTDKEDSKKASEKDKNDVLGRLKGELDNTTREGMLNSPAIISPYGMMLPTFTTGPLFSTEQEGGQMLVTENPSYFRKDVPDYVPQFFVLSWRKLTTGYGGTFSNAVNENFPIEKLQAMIDK